MNSTKQGQETKDVVTKPLSGWARLRAAVQYSTNDPGRLAAK